MYSSTIAAVLLAVSTAQAALNGACTASGKPGVCISTNDCTADGGSYVSGACPNDAENIKCCYKSCGSGGTCRFTSSCSGTTQTGLCPGPTDFKCCLPSGGGSSSVPWPKANCQATAINSGERILAQFPGKVSQVWCYANKPNSDHATGMALDFMVGVSHLTPFSKHPLRLLSQQVYIHTHT